MPRRDTLLPGHGGFKRGDVYPEVWVEWCDYSVEWYMAALNIKSEETYRLVRELAELTGESMTDAVKHAVEERLLRVRDDRQGRWERMLALAEDAAGRFKEPWRSAPHGDLLYDERGLPK